MLLSFSASRSATPRRWPALLRTVVLSGVLAGSLSACVPLMVTGVVGGLLLATDRRSWAPSWTTKPSKCAAAAVSAPRCKIAVRLA